MVKEKGIPSICGAKECGMCASNCQFYKNEKGYERALKEVLACSW